MRINVKTPMDIRARRIIQRDPVLQQLLTHSPDEIEDWLNANITTTQSAVAILKKIVLLCWYLAKGLKATYQEVTDS